MRISNVVERGEGKVVVKISSQDESIVRRMSETDYEELGLSNPRRRHDWCVLQLITDVQERTADHVSTFASRLLPTSLPSTTAKLTRVAAAIAAACVVFLAGYSASGSEDRHASDERQQASETRAPRPPIKKADEVRMWTRDRLREWAIDGGMLPNDALRLAFDRCRTEGIDEAVVKAVFYGRKVKERPDGSVRDHVVAALRFLYAKESNAALQLINDYAPLAGFEAEKVKRIYWEIFSQ